jgi:hypothetical protein
VAVEPDHIAEPAPVEFPDGSGNVVGGHFGLKMESADSSLGGGAALDSFDFDSFLKADDGGKGFDFANFDIDPDDHESDAQGRPSQLPLATENAQLHGRKRPHSSAFLGLPAKPSCRKRRATEVPCTKGEIRKASAGADELTADSNEDEVSTNSLSGIQALMERWFNASATAELLMACNE